MSKTDEFESKDKTEFRRYEYGCDEEDILKKIAAKMDKLPSDGSVK